MKLEEELKAVRYFRENIDLTVNDDGFVILPAWQFALFVREYERLRTNVITWAIMFIMLAFVFVIFLPLLG